MESLNPYAVAGALMLAVCGAIFFLARLGDDAPKAWKAVKSVASAPFVIERMWSEFQNNGGQSLRDRIDKSVRLNAEALVEAKLARAISEATANKFGVDVAAIRDEVGELGRRVDHLEGTSGEKS